MAAADLVVPVVFFVVVFFLSPLEKSEPSSPEATSESNKFSAMLAIPPLPEPRSPESSEEIELFLDDENRLETSVSSAGAIVERMVLTVLFETPVDFETAVFVLSSSVPNIFLIIFAPSARSTFSIMLEIDDELSCCERAESNDFSPLSEDEFLIRPDNNDGAAADITDSIADLSSPVVLLAAVRLCDDSKPLKILLMSIIPLHSANILFNCNIKKRQIQ